MDRPSLFPLISVAALLLAYGVVVLGAYTRLSNAGLGCPDWPGCYGKIMVPAEAEAGQAEALHPDRPLRQGKAWIEMIHRYAAAVLGLLVFALALSAWRGRRRLDQPLWLPLVLLGLVVFQALLGMWTVTWLLKPIVVSAHLLGGMTLLALLCWLVLQGFFDARDVGGAGRLWPWAAVGLMVLALQIFLGGWTSANYAALVCPEFPACRGGDWWPAADFHQGFIFWRGLGTDYEYGVLDVNARTAVHLAHRAGAVAAAIVIGVVAILAVTAQDRRARAIGAAIAILLGVQIALGIANVLLSLPLPVAVAHNGTAALLLLSLVALLRYAVIGRS